MPRLLRMLVAPLPLVAGLWLLRLVPTVAQGQPPLLVGPYWRLDALAVVAPVLLALGAARPRSSSSVALRLALGVPGAAIALAATAPFVGLLVLALVTLLLVDGLGPRWWLALVALAAATLLPAFFDLGASPRMFTLVMLSLAAFVGTGGVPWPARGVSNLDPELVLRPVWLFPLLRSLQDGQWPLSWTLLVPLVGMATAALAIINALAAPQSKSRAERLLAAILLQALACIGLSTTLGVVGMLWIILAHGLCLLWLPSDGEALAAPALVALFVAAWWTVAATSAAKAFVLSGVAVFIVLAGIGAVMLYADQFGSHIGEVHPRPSIPYIILTGVMVVLLVACTPLATRFVGIPVADHLGAGLTAFGLLDVWPFVGVGALDAAHRRAALLPSVALGPLVLVLLAISWLVLRLLPHRSREEQVATEPLPSEPAPAMSIRQRLWWTGTQRHG